MIAGEYTPFEKRSSVTKTMEDEVIISVQFFKKVTFPKVCWSVPFTSYLDYFNSSYLSLFRCIR